MAVAAFDCSSADAATLGPVVDVAPERRKDDGAAPIVSVAVRYLAVSAINVVNHQALLLLAHGVWGWGGGVANVFAAVIAAVPGYLLSRSWVWSVRGTHSVRSEIVPFWTLALLGLVVSTVLAEAADRSFDAPLAVSAASLAGYFVVWVVKFLVLNRIFERSARRLEHQELGVR